MPIRKRNLLVAAAGLLAVAGRALAHGDAAHPAGPAKKEQKPWGIAADAKAAARTVEVRMSDAMRFTPARLEVREGETVRFVVRNTGQVPHELSLGTLQDLLAHREQMARQPGMTHAEPNQITLAPGQQGEIVWRFTRAGTVHFACLIPGHYEAGMKGQIRVAAGKHH